MTRTAEIEGSPESARFDGYLTDRPGYHGRSERIHGFNRIAEAVGLIPNIRTVEPVILSENLYAEYAANGLSASVRDCAEEIMTRLQGDKYPLIVRRLFPDQNGDAKDGPRSGNVQSVDDLITEIGRFYNFFTASYDTSEVIPEIMVHRVIDAGNPPLKEDPFLPYPAGDVTPIDNDSYQIRALFGADESVQGYPCDSWTVKYDPDGSVTISQPTRQQKTHVKIPAPGEYKEIEIPEDAQNLLPLSRLQVLSLAEVAKNLCDQHGPYRLEFDGTKVDNQEPLVIIEAAPFKVFKNSYEGLKTFGERIIRPLNLITSSEDIHALPPNDLAVVHLPPQMFQGNNLRVALTDLALTAKAKNIPLAVLVAGGIATQHAIRDIIDNGHAVWFTGTEEFEQGEEIRVYRTTDGGYNWERENPIVSQEKVLHRQLRRIGGKALGLQKLEAHGFKTAPYFVLETSVFRRIIEDLGLTEDLERLDQLPATDRLDSIATFTDHIIKKIIERTDGQIPDLSEALAQIGARLSSVRSSGVLEDGHMSHAGIYDTKLNVAPKELRKAILEVFTSAISPLAVKSALGMNARPSEAGMALIVQRMVEAQAAGTIFTKDHLTNDKDVIRIEVVRGLGNQIVDGTAKTEDTQLILIERTTGNILENDVSGEKPVLDDNQIMQLAKLGLAVEIALNEGFQDIEWAVDKDGEIFLMQTRPL